MGFNILDLLFTYNGEKFLPDQLDSTPNQINQKWKVVASDNDQSEANFFVMLLILFFGGLFSCSNFRKIEG